ncbi:carbohydrate binding domain-containing protein [Victivallis vadensis]|uniref:carbohydrate binding domain-containing protein n=1 Tax=Victivallis vadensis TaxID=172901 RepID=UPI003AF47992
MKPTVIFALFALGAFALPADETLFAEGAGGELRTAALADFQERKVIRPAMAGWGMDLTPAVTDWSEFDALVLEIYSARAGQDAFMVTMDSRNPADPDSKGYFNRKLPVDWTGWKTVTLPFSEFTRSRNPAGWHRIGQLHMTPKGYGITPAPGAEIYIGSIRLRSGKAPDAAKPVKKEPARQLSLPQSDAPDVLFADGKSGGEWKIAKIVEFDGAPAVEPALTGWGASVIPANRDWSGYDAVVFDMYSERANRENFMVTADSNPEGKNGNYYMTRLPVTWTGWKTVVLPFRNFTPSRAPVGWNRIDAFYFSTKGYGLTPEPGGKVYIRNIRLRPREKQDPAALREVRPFPINPAESVISPFWDPAVSDFPKWKVDLAAGKVSQGWDGGGIRFQGKAVLTREMEFDCSRFDTLIPALALIPGTKIEVAAETDLGPRVKSYVAPDDKGRTSEYPLPLEGAKTLRQLRITLENPEPADAIFKWVLIADSRRRADLDRMYRELGDIDFSLYIKGERDTVPTFTPGLGIYCDAATVERARRHALDDPAALARMEKKIAAIRATPPPESTISAYTTRDRRFTRDRDFTLPNPYDIATPAWLGALKKDPELLRLAARRAIALALHPHWGAGMLASMPGTEWQHRCFDECNAMENLVFALDFCHDFFTDTGRNLILRLLAERGAGTANFNAWKYDYIYNCNQLSAFSIGRVAAYLAMEKAGWKHVKPYTELAMRELDENMNRILEADGGYTEGPSYYQYTFWGALPAYSLYARARGREFRDVLPASLKGAPDYMELMFSTDDRQGVLPVNDGNSGIYSQNSVILAGMFPGTVFDRLVNKYRSMVGPIPAEDRWSWMAGDPTRRAENPPLRNFVKVDSIASAASVRELGGKVLKIAFLNDTKASAHKHPDAGNFILEFNGETFAMDSGICHYSSPFSKVLQREDRHNVMAPLDDAGFLTQNRVGTVPAFTASGDAKEFHASADLMNCWQGKFKVRTRSLDSDFPETLTITDRYETANGKGVAFFWLSPFPFRVDGRRVVIQGKKGSVRFDIPAGWEFRTERLTRENASDQYRLTLTSPRPEGELKLAVAVSM